VPDRLQRQEMERLARNCNETSPAPARSRCLSPRSYITKRGFLSQRVVHPRIVQASDRCCGETHA
jgi:hypothetical protein